MGATTFTTLVRVPKNATDQEAFLEAKDADAHEFGHGGYTGTLAEKNSFIMIHRARTAEGAKHLHDAIMNFGDHNQIVRKELKDLIEDKSGPAGAIRHPIDAENDGVIFFGWASC